LPPKDLGGPRDASQPALSLPKGSLRRNNRAFGSLPYRMPQTVPHC